MRELPDCIFCDANQSLQAERVEPNGVLVCLCSCCAKQCRVNADGLVIHTPDARDASGRQMFDP